MVEISGKENKPSAAGHQLCLPVQDALHQGRLPCQGSMKAALSVWSSEAYWHDGKESKGPPRLRSQPYHSKSVTIVTSFKYVV